MHPRTAGRGGGPYTHEEAREKVTRDGIAAVERAARYKAHINPGCQTAPCIPPPQPPALPPSIPRRAR